MSRPLLFVRRLKSTSSQKYLDIKHKITKTAVWLLCVSKHSHTHGWNALEWAQQRFLETIWYGAYTNSLRSSEDSFLQCAPGVGKQLLALLRPSKSSFFSLSVCIFPIPSLASPLILLMYWDQSLPPHPFLFYFLLLFSSFFYIYKLREALQWPTSISEQASSIWHIFWWTGIRGLMWLWQIFGCGILSSWRLNIYPVLFTM